MASLRLLRPTPCVRRVSARAIKSLSAGPKAVELPYDKRVAGAEVIERGAKARPVRRPARFVLEDPLAAPRCERVALEV